MNHVWNITYTFCTFYFYLNSYYSYFIYRCRDLMVVCGGGTRHFHKGGGRGYKKSDFKTIFIEKSKDTATITNHGKKLQGRNWKYSVKTHLPIYSLDRKGGCVPWLAYSRMAKLQSKWIMFHTFHINYIHFIFILIPITVPLFTVTGVSWYYGSTFSYAINVFQH